MGNGIRDSMHSVGKAPGGGGASHDGCTLLLLPGSA